MCRRLDPEPCECRLQLWNDAIRGDELQSLIMLPSRSSSSDILSKEVSLLLGVSVACLVLRDSGGCQCVHVESGHRFAPLRQEEMSTSTCPSEGQMSLISQYKWNISRDFVFHKR